MILDVCLVAQGWAGRYAGEFVLFKELVPVVVIIVHSRLQDRLNAANSKAGRGACPAARARRRVPVGDHPRQNGHRDMGRSVWEMQEIKTMKQTLLF